MDENKRICSACGAKIVENEKYCRVCGMNIGESEDVIVVKRDTAGVSFGAKLRIAPRAVLVRNAVLLALSLIILISAFLPIISFNGVDVSPIQGVVLATELLITDSIEDVNESRLGEAVWEIFEWDDAQDLDLSSEILAFNAHYPYELEDSEASAAAYLLARYIFRVTEGGPVIMACASALALLVHMILALILFVRATKNFIRLATGKKTLYRSAISQFCFMLPFIIVTYFAISSIGFFDTAAGLGFLLSVISLSIGIAYAAVELGVNNYKQGRQIITPRKIIAVALAIVLVCMIFVPVASLSVEGVYGGRIEEKNVTLPIDTAFFSELSPTSAELAAYDYLYSDRFYAVVTSEMLLDEIYGMTAREVKSESAGKGWFSCLLTVAYFSNYETDFAYKFSFIPVVAFVAGLAAVFVVWQRLKHICLDSISGKSVITFGVIGAAAAMALLVLAVMFVSSVGYAMKYIELNDFVSCGISSGGILLLVAFVVNTFMPTKKIVFVNSESAS